MARDRVLSVNRDHAYYLVAVAAPLLLAPAFLEPILGIALIVGVPAVLLAARSVAYPVALAGLPSVAIGFLGHNPFPVGSVFAFLTGWTLLGIAFELMREGSLAGLRYIALPFAITVLLGALLVFRSDGTTYSSLKLQIFLATAPLALIAGALLTRHSGTFSTYLGIVVVVGIANGMLLLKQLIGGDEFDYYSARVTTSSVESPIGAGRQAAYGILISIFLVLVAVRPFLRILGTFALPVLVISLLASGSRGPLLALIVSIGVLLALLPWSRQNRQRSLIVIVAAVLTIALVPAVVPSSSLSRATAIFSGSDVGRSSNGRTASWDEAWQMFRENPLSGSGTGSFATHDGILQYPHNILLEEAAEVGILGAALVLALLGFGIWTGTTILRSATGYERAEAALVCALLVGAIVNAMLSDAIEGADRIWLAIGLIGGIRARHESVAASTRVRGKRGGNASGLPGPHHARIDPVPS